MTTWLMKHGSERFVIEGEGLLVTRLTRVQLRMVEIASRSIA